MLTVAAALCLVIALAIDVSRAGSPTMGALWLTGAGLALLGLAAIFPRWPRRRPRTDRRLPVSREPHYGRTKHGLAVHLRTVDHHPAGTAYQRFNKRVAMALTGAVGTMTCFWLFCCLSLCSLPAVLSAFSAFRGTFPGWMIRASIIALVAWVAQTLIQLVLLPALMVGQNLQNQAADARSAKQFEDTEVIVDRLDVNTEGGIKAILDALDALAAQVAAPAPVVSMPAPPAPKAQAKRLATRAERSKERNGT